MKKINQKLKEQKGSVTLFILISCIFFLIIIVAITTMLTNKNINQEQDLKQIQETYASNIDKDYEEQLEVLRTKINEPIIEIVSGTKGENSWYTSDVVIKISKNTDEQDVVSAITYALSGATAKEEAEITSDETITITNEGITYITAYAIDNRNNKSKSNVLEIKKDSIAPEIIYTDDALVYIDTTIDETYIRSNATISDNLTEVTINDLTIKDSENATTTNDLTGYDIYTANYNLKDEAGNTKAVAQTITTKPTTGVTLTNFIPDPSFENNDLTDWGNWSDSDTLEIATDRKRSGNYSFKFTGITGQAFPRKNYGDLGIAGKNIYIAGYSNINSDTRKQVAFFAYSASDTNMWPDEEIGGHEWGQADCYDEWGKGSIILTAEQTKYNNLILMLAQGITTEGSYIMWWDDLYGVDLSPFGDRVLTKKWADKMLEYFEGTKTFTW